MKQVQDVEQVVQASGRVLGKQTMLHLEEGHKFLDTSQKIKELRMIFH